MASRPHRATGLVCAQPNVELKGDPGARRQGWRRALGFSEVHRAHQNMLTRGSRLITLHPMWAGIAQLVEYELPKLGVAGSNPVARSSGFLHLSVSVDERSQTGGVGLSRLSLFEVGARPTGVASASLTSISGY
jgi:hypothetical protein